MMSRISTAPLSCLLWGGCLLTWSSCSTGMDMRIVDERSQSLYGRSEIALSASVAQDRSRPASTRPKELFEDVELESWVRYGLEHNSSLKAAFDRWRSSTERVAQVEALPDPIFSFFQFVEELQTRTGPQKRRYGLSQALPWFGKLGLSGDVALQDAEVLWQVVLQRRLEIETEIRTAYHEYGYLGELIRITKENLDLLKQMEPVVQRGIQAGRGQEDLLRLQVEIGKLENGLLSLQRRRPMISARLALAVHWRGEELLPMPPLTEPEAEAADMDRKGLLGRVEQRNPRLQALREKVLRERKASDLARLAGAPDVVIGVEYMETGPAINANTPGSGDDPYGFRISVNLPIQRSKYSAAERQANFALSASRSSLRELSLRLRSEVENEIYLLDDATRQIRLHKETLLPRSRQTLNVTRTSYSAGRASLLDLIDSERALLAFETSYWRACRDTRQARARLDLLLGGKLESPSEHR
jgi:outer membrane protein, heavy metal efflux system